MPRNICCILLTAGLLLASVFAHAAAAPGASPMAGISGVSTGHAPGGGVTAERGRPVLLAQSAGTPSLAGLYSGKVYRSKVTGEQEKTRTYSVRLNDDLTTGTIDVYELNSQFVAHLGFAGQFSGGVFIGKTVVLNAPSGYIPDNIRITFAADHHSLQWYHNDGTMQGSGTLSR